MCAMGQIYESEIVVGLKNGNELYGKAKIPNGYNKSLVLKEAGSYQEIKIKPEDVTYIVIDVLVSKKKNLISTYQHREVRVDVVTLNLGSENKPKWVYAQHLIDGDLSYYGWQFRSGETEMREIINNFGFSDPNINYGTPLVSTEVIEKYTFSCDRYCYKTIDDKIHVANKYAGAYLKENAAILMYDCPNLIEEISVQKRFEKGDVENYIERYNDGCY
jgi:hypothetical protein